MGSVLSAGTFTSGSGSVGASVSVIEESGSVGSVLSVGLFVSGIGSVGVSVSVVVEVVSVGVVSAASESPSPDSIASV